MAQQPNRDDNKLPRFGNRAGEDGQGPKKGPRFSIYWIYAIIIAVLIGFQLYGPFSPNMKAIDQDTFTDILRNGDVGEYTIVSNKNVVRITLKDSALDRYRKTLKKTDGKISDKGPHLYFKIVSGDSFQMT